MILSHTCQVAIKSIACIVENETGCINVKELAAITEENPHTIAKVLQNLVKAGMLSSVTGPHGGFMLSRKQLAQPLIEIVKIVDGTDSFDNCVLGLKQCDARHQCPVHEKYVPVRKEIRKIFAQTKLSQLALIPELVKNF